MSNETFVEIVESEIKRDSLDILSKKPAHVIAAAVDDVDSVFVRDPEEDTPEMKKAVVVAYLRNIADALEDEGNPLDFAYSTSTDGLKYSGRGLAKYVVSRSLAEVIIPLDMQKRSVLNRRRRAAKNAM